MYICIYMYARIIDKEILVKRKIINKYYTSNYLNMLKR